MRHISPLGEVPAWSTEANCEQDRPHKLVRWAEHYRELWEDLGREVEWSGFNSGHPMFRMSSPGKAKWSR